MVDTTKPINSDWILVILTVGWILYSIVHATYEVFLVLSVIWIIMILLGDSE